MNYSFMDVVDVDMNVLNNNGEGIKTGSSNVVVVVADSK